MNQEIHPRVLREWSNAVAKPFYMVLKKPHNNQRKSQVVTWEKGRYCLILEGGGPANDLPISLTYVPRKVMEQSPLETVLRPWRTGR